MSASVISLVYGTVSKERFKIAIYCQSVLENNVDFLYKIWHDMNRSSRKQENQDEVTLTFDIDQFLDAFQQTTCFKKYLKFIQITTYKLVAKQPVV